MRSTLACVVLLLVVSVGVAQNIPCDDLCETTPIEYGGVQLELPERWDAAADIRAADWGKTYPIYGSIPPRRVIDIPLRETDARTGVPNIMRIIVVNCADYRDMGQQPTEDNYWLFFCEPLTDITPEENEYVYPEHPTGYDIVNAPYTPRPLRRGWVFPFQEGLGRRALFHPTTRDPLGPMIPAFYHVYNGLTDDQQYMVWIQTPIALDAKLPPYDAKRFDSASITPELEAAHRAYVEAWHRVVRHVPPEQITPLLSVLDAVAASIEIVGPVDIDVPPDECDPITAGACDDWQIYSHPIHAR